MPPPTDEKTRRAVGYAVYRQRMINQGNPVKLWSDLDNVAQLFNKQIGDAVVQLLLERGWQPPAKGDPLQLKEIK